MTGAMMMERTGMGMPGAGPMGGVAGTTGLMAPGVVMVPRCTFKMEKCQGGMKITCVCDDAMARSTMQNHCTMLAGGMCGCCMTLNRMTVCGCNFTMGMCKCDLTDKGVTFTCTSGDAKCSEMIQACCDCLSAMLKSGCTCCLMLNNMPVCCGS
jgi:hypothetical protein